MVYASPDSCATLRYASIHKYITENLSVCLSVRLEYAVHRQQTLHQGVNNSGTVTDNNRQILESDLQSNSEKFYNLKASPSECYCNAAANIH